MFLISDLKKTRTRLNSKMRKMMNTGIVRMGFPFTPVSLSLFLSFISLSSSEWKICKKMRMEEKFHIPSLVPAPHHYWHQPMIPSSHIFSSSLSLSSLSFFLSFSLASVVSTSFFPITVEAGNDYLDGDLITLLQRSIRNWILIIILSLSLSETFFIGSFHPVSFRSKTKVGKETRDKERRGRKDEVIARFPFFLLPDKDRFTFWEKRCLVIIYSVVIFRSGTDSIIVVCNGKNKKK